MFETFRNAWKTEDLRKRLLYTLLILILFRLGCAIPVPYITSSALESMFTTGSMLTYLNMMSGGAMSRCTIFALGVQPYINATIIIQLLCVALFLPGYAHPCTGWCFRLLHYDPCHGHSGPCCCDLCSDPDQR